MTGDSGYGTGSINFYANVLWVWTGICAIVTAIWASYAFGYFDEFNGVHIQNGTAAFIGFFVGALSTLPFWALFGLGAHIARKLDRLQVNVKQESKAAERARAEVREAATVGAAGPGSEDTAADESSATGEPLSFELIDLLADPTLRAEVSRTRKLYGRKVAAEFLTRKAQEAGYTDLVVTDEDLPTDL